MAVFSDGIDETEVPTSAMVETDVVIIGSGPAGASMALALSRLGVKNIMLTKYRWTANTPRAHITKPAMSLHRAAVISGVTRGLAWSSTSP
jgi:2,4-dichlorophenol 6-monooxygenase